jgi:signal transduction histidine kinase
VDVTVRLERRLPPPVETAAYFVVAEALANIGKHSRARACSVRLLTNDTRLTIEVADDGVGRADETRGTGLVGLRKRVRALDGSLEIESPAGGPTVLLAEIPCAR